MTAVRRIALFAATLAIALSTAVTLAHAEAPKPTIIGSIPVGFTYTHDQGQKGVDAQSPTGVQVEFISPYYLGIGFAQYKSAIKKKSWDLGGGTTLSSDLGMTYSFLEASANIKFGPVLLAWGYGAGSVKYNPETTDTVPPGFKVKWNASQAFERFIRIGLHVSPDWSIHVASHALYAEADQEFSTGTKHSGEIGAIMTTAGVGYSF